MKLSYLRVLIIILMTWTTVSAQEIINVGTSNSNICQCDTIEVTFTVSQALNSGNEFSVELSSNTGVFSGNFIEESPLLGFGVGGYNMDAVIPCSTAPGTYSIRVQGDNPSTISDTLMNVVIGELPDTNVTVFGTYIIAGEQRFCDGEMATLVAPPPPMGETYSYQWFDGGILMSGETDDSLEVSVGGLYSVEVTKGSCSAFSREFTLNSFDPMSAITVASNPDVTIINSDSIAFL